MRERTRLVADVVAEPRRGPCTDAERRTARALQRRLLRGGRDASLETVWVRPQWPLSLLIHAGAGVAGSLLAVAVPRPAVVVLIVVLGSAVVEASGRGRLLSLVLHRRATQNVVSPPAHERTYRLIVTAPIDAGRGGYVHRPAVRPAAAGAQRAAHGLLPGPAGWLALLLLGVLACAGARVAGASGAAIGAVQLVPTVGLVLVCAIALDLATSSVAPGANEAGSAVAVALDLVAALDATPPRALGVELVLAGAGEGGALGFARYLAAQRDLVPERTAVLDLRPCGVGSPRWWTHDGPLLGLPAYAQLRRLAERVASEEAALGAKPHRSRRRSAAHAARQRRLPSLGVGCLAADGTLPLARTAADVPENLDEAALVATLDFCLAFVAALDDELQSFAATRRAELTAAGR
jgi:hypothetical protein